MDISHNLLPTSLFWILPLVISSHVLKWGLKQTRWWKMGRENTRLPFLSRCSWVDSGSSYPRVSNEYPGIFLKPLNVSCVFFLFFLSKNMLITTSSFSSWFNSSGSSVVKFLFWSSVFFFFLPQKTDKTLETDWEILTAVQMEIIIL